MPQPSSFDAARLRWAGTRRARGSFDLIKFDGTTATVAGWLMRADQPIERVAVYVNEHLLGEQPVAYRDDLAEVFGGVPHAGASAFGISGEFDPAGVAVASVAAVGIPAAGERFVLQRYRLTTPQREGALPPAHLRLRVAATEDARIFSDSGADNALQFIAFLRRHMAAGDRPRVLDWGCGVGRMDRYLLRFWPEAELTGVDIDAEAVAWCAANLGPAAFHTVSPYVPLPFADASFDAVLGYSVMTHLPRTQQREWLAEIRRVLVPGGVFATSVHGVFATALDPAMSAALEAAGIMDEALDPALDGVAPEGYYRATFQTPAYTRENWGKELEIIEYVEGGLSALHDLVGMRRAS